jgi:hypothetical protein
VFFVLVLVGALVGFLVDRDADVILVRVVVAAIGWASFLWRNGPAHVLPARS